MFECHSLNIVRDITITVQVKMCQVLDAVVTFSESQGHWTGNAHMNLQFTF